MKSVNREPIDHFFFFFPTSERSQISLLLGSGAVMGGKYQTWRVLMLAVMFSIVMPIHSLPQPGFFQELGLWTWAHFCGYINILRDSPACIGWIMICSCDYHSFCNFISIKRVRLKGVALPNSPRLGS